MLPLGKAKRILNSNREEKLTDRQVREVLGFIEILARLSVELYHKNKEDEKSSTDVQGQQ